MKTSIETNGTIKVGRYTYNKVLSRGSSQGMILDKSYGQTAIVRVTGTDKFLYIKA